MGIKFGLPDEITNCIETIASDHIHGSIYLTRKAIHLINDFVDQYEFINNEYEDFINKCVLILKKLITAQPQMASIFTFSNNILYFIDVLQRDNIKNYLKNFCTKQTEHLDSNYKEIGDNSNQILQGKTKIFTYSFSSTIYHTLVNYGASNKSIQIYCSESRPNNEGILLAEKLGKQNVATTLVTDSYLFSKIHHADIVLIGADAISNKGVINKIGSRPLIQLAMQYHVPRFVLCSMDKMLPSGYHMNEESLKSADQITKVSIPNVNLINKYFDNTPLDLFDGIVTEQGIFSSRDITLIMDKIFIHDRLKSI